MFDVHCNQKGNQKKEDSRCVSDVMLGGRVDGTSGEEGIY